MKTPCLEILPDTFQVNIDTLKFSVDDVVIDFSDVTKMMVTSAEGELLCIKTNRKPLPGVFGRHSLQMRCTTKENQNQGELLIEGSPFGNRYGQNVFTSGNLKSACLWTLGRVRELYDVQVQPETVERWKAGMVELHRVDLAVNFKLDSGDHVDKALKQLKQLLAAQRVQCHLHDKYASLTPRGGKNYSVTAYSKGAQMGLLAARSKSDEVLTKLAADCAAILRIEIRLQRGELQRLGLAQVRAWSPTIARNIYRKYFSRLPLSGITFGPLTSNDFDGVDFRMRPVLAHHKLGTNPKLIYSDRTRVRHRAYFKRLGIDLNVPNDSGQPVSLTDVLSKRGAILKTPQWLTEAGMAPPMKNRGTA